MFPALTELFIPPCYGRNEKDYPGSPLGLREIPTPIGGLSWKGLIIPVVRRRVVDMLYNILPSLKTIGDVGEGLGICIIYIGRVVSPNIYITPTNPLHGCTATPAEACRVCRPEGR